jgi:hypothetical protein
VVNLYQKHTIIPKVEYSIVKDKEEKSKEKERIGDESKKANCNSK